MKEREKKNNLVSRAEAVARQPQCVGLDVVYDLALPPITSLFMTYKYVWFFSLFFFFTFSLLYHTLELSLRMKEKKKRKTS